MIIILIINALFNATIFGIFIDLLSIVQSKTMEKMNELDDTNEAMEHLASLPAELKSKVRVYQTKTFEFKSLQKELDLFLSGLRE